MKKYKAYIYCIIDPDTMKVVYVGQTCCLGMRKTNHYYSGANSQTRIGQYMYNCRINGKEAIFKTLERVEMEDRLAAEKKWILRKLKYGHPLLNANKNKPALRYITPTP